jgi:predicted AlkP superfamily pyrophosphatase or phosphodiesterase
MAEKLVPDYKNGSIVNLMSSIAKSFGSKSDYKPLKNFDLNLLKSKNIVLMVFDGMGYEFLKKHGKGTVLDQNLKCKITSVFPPTTAAAITTFLTGKSPKEHGLVSWFIYLRELGRISAILPFVERGSGLPLQNFIDPKEIFDFKPFSNKIKAPCYAINKSELRDTIYTKATTGKSKRLGYSNLDGCFRQIKKCINSNNKRKFIYAYWPGIDSLSHHYGTEHNKTLKHFREICRKAEKFIRSLKDSDTTLIITADHGLSNISKEAERIGLDNHPKLKEMLTLPLSGDARTIYCYVRSSRAKDFENYIKKKFKGKIKLYKSDELVKKGYFGIGKEHKSLRSRIGDYILLCEKNYVFYDRVPGEEKKKHHVGNHAGLSKEELYVPLIVVKTKS